VTVAQDWTKPPPDAVFNLRIPVDYASIQAAVSSVYLSSEYEVEGLCSTEIGGWTLHLCMPFSYHFNSVFNKSTVDW
jgi:hypothetical protein